MLTNEAAERLLDHLKMDDLWLPIASEALAAERRATVERIGSAYLASYVPDGSEEFYRGIDAASAALRTILDKEAAP